MTQTDFKNFETVKRDTVEERQVKVRNAPIFQKSEY